MSFASLSKRLLFAAPISGIIGVSAAFSGLGVWSLVIRDLSFQLVMLIALWRVSSWRPGLGVSLSHAKELFSFGVSEMGSNIVGFLRTQGVVLIIGSVLGSTALGFYHLASRLYTILITSVAVSRPGRVVSVLEIAIPFTGIEASLLQRNSILDDSFMAVVFGALGHIFGADARRVRGGVAAKRPGAASAFNSRVVAVDYYSYVKLVSCAGKAGATASIGVIGDRGRISWVLTGSEIRCRRRGLGVGGGRGGGHSNILSQCS
jgi:hypothetical protein